jgi:hypothetical protein
VTGADPVAAYAFSFEKRPVPANPVEILSRLHDPQRGAY